MRAMLAHELSNTRTRRLLLIALGTFFVILFIYSSSDVAYVRDVKSRLPSWQTASPSTNSTKVEPIVLDPRCADLPGAKDVLLVMKTGSSVIDKRLPIHFKTTFRCTPDFLVFSDLAQDFHGLQVHDSLDELHKYVDMSNPDLAYYEYLRKSSERKQKAHSGGWSSGRQQEEEIPADFQESNAAWEMDKYKNYPILRKSYAMYPDKKWYLFVDADTSVMWTNILTWVSLLDHTKPFYTGSQNWIGDVEFAHGGSGYIVSHAAAKILADEDEESAKQHTSYAEHQCCGDMVLAHAFHDNQIALNGSWPNIQGATPVTLDYDIHKWCYAAMTFHHTPPEQVEHLWNIDRALGPAKNVTYADIFREFVQPSLQHEANEWDNGSEDVLYPPKRSREEYERDPDASWQPSPEEKLAVSSYQGCRSMCKQREDCFSFVYRPNTTSEGQQEGMWPGQCGMRIATIILGAKSTEGLDDGRGAVRSGWDLERIEMWARKHTCDKAIYLTQWGNDGSLEPPN